MNERTATWISKQPCNIQKTSLKSTRNFRNHVHYIHGFAQKNRYTVNYHFSNGYSKTFFLLIFTLGQHHNVALLGNSFMTWEANQWSSSSWVMLLLIIFLQQSSALQAVIDRRFDLMSFYPASHVDTIWKLWIWDRITTETAPLTLIDWDLHRIG